MVKSIYVVEDKKMGFNSPLSLYDNDAVAIRDFSNACKQPGLLSSNPEDFYLWRIGSFDTSCNKLEVLESPICISKAGDFAKKVEVSDV